jgi:hypothetical protein
VTKIQSSKVKPDAREIVSSFDALLMATEFGRNELESQNHKITKSQNHLQDSKTDLREFLGHLHCE